MTTTRAFRSSDAGAPALDGTVGSGIAWLKTCLVGVAGIAYGSGPAEKAAAGWSIAFESEANNVCVFRNSLAAGGSGMYLRIDDNGTGTGGAREMLVRIYASMSDINTGTEATPSPAQLASGIVWRKSVTLNSTAREWELAADELTLSLSVYTGYDGNPAFPNQLRAYIFGHAGDYVSYDPLIGKPCVLCGSPVASASPGYTEGGVGPLQWNSSAHGINVMQTAGGAATPANAYLNLMAYPSLASNATGGSSMPMEESDNVSAATHFIPALIGASGAGAGGLYGHLRGLFTTINKLHGVALGTNFPAPGGRPPGSNLRIFGHYCGTSASPMLAGRVGVETAEAWS